MLEQSLKKLSNTKLNLKKPLKVIFKGENGQDQGGPKKQYFQLIIKQLFDANFGMFLIKQVSSYYQNYYYWFNSQSWEAPVMFELVGIIMGLAMYNSILLDLKFPWLLYKKLLNNEETYNRKQCLNDLKNLDFDLYKHLIHILEFKGDVQKEFMLDFSVREQIFGEIRSFELKPKGQKILVNSKNKQQYVQLYAQWICKKSIEKQFLSFKKGFYKVASTQLMKVSFIHQIFSPQQLEQIICGSKQLNFKQLQQGTKYQSFTEDSQIIKYQINKRQFWNIVHSFTEQQKRKFLSFTTGCDRAPIKGLKSLGFKIQRHGVDSNNLPTAHTCFNILLLPQYKDPNKLKQKLLLAIQHNQGFGLI